jgi:hypothetical protein
MMRIAIVVPVLAALAGCAPTQEVLKTGHRYEYASGSGPRKLAGCTSVNAGSFSRYFTSHVEPLVRPDTYQVVVTQTKYWHFEPIIVAHATPAPAGSQLVVFVSNDLPPTLAADWVARLRKGCDEMRPAAVIVPVPPTVVPAAPAPQPAPPARGTRG